MRLWTPADERAQARRTQRYFELWGYRYCTLDSVPVVEAFGFGAKSVPFVPVVREQEERVGKLYDALREEYGERLSPGAAAASACADLSLSGLVYPNAAWVGFPLVKNAIQERRLRARLPGAQEKTTTKRL